MMEGNIIWEYLIASNLEDKIFRKENPGSWQDEVDQRLGY